MVLMVQHRFTADSSPGNFYYKMAKANEEEAQEFIRLNTVMAHKAKIFDEIKKSNQNC